MKTLPFLALILLGQATPALAEPAAQLPSQAVRTADLDLSTETDRKRLAHRIRHAATIVCGEASDVDPAGKNDVRRCRTETRRGAQIQVNTAIAAAERPAIVASAN